VYYPLMPDFSLKKNPYRLHRLALAPLLPGATGVDSAAACQQIATMDAGPFADFVCQQGLAPMWDKILEDSGSTQLLPEEFRNTIHQARLHATGAYLSQHHNLSLIKTALEKADVPHVVYKGADLRERLYEEPALRPAADIDILVPDSKKVLAINALQRLGFEFSAAEYNISHEANLNRGLTSIDLHWDILRQGRTRIPMVATLLESRKDYGSHWGMSNEASLFVMLVHPVFTKYGTAPQASLMRTVDLARLLAMGNINWQAVLQLLSDAGLKTAAWVTLRWHEMLTHAKPPAGFIAALEPGRLRQKYLSHWLEQDYSGGLLEKPLYVQLGFTLPAHDKWGDAIRAVRRARELRRSQETDMKQLLQSTAVY
jgi:hypothetical protein